MSRPNRGTKESQHDRNNLEEKACEDSETTEGRKRRRKFRSNEDFKGENSRKESIGGGVGATR